MSLGQIKSPSARANCSSFKCRVSTLPCQLGYRHPPSAQSPPLPRRRCILPYQTPRTPVSDASTESHAWIPCTSRTITNPSDILPGLSSATAPGPGRAGGFIRPPPPPAEMRGREVFPRPMGAPTSPEAAGYTHRERLRVFFSSERAFAGKGLVSQGLQPNPRGPRWQQGAGEGMRCRH